MEEPTPAQPVLAPGVHVTRRDRGSVQVGLAPAAAVVLADTAAVAQLLDDLRHGRAPDLDPPGAREALTRLWFHGLVVDGTALSRSRRAAPGRHQAVAASYALHPQQAPRRLAARRAAWVVLDGPPVLVDPLRTLLRAAGVLAGLARPSRPSRPPRRLAAVRVVAADRVLARERVDPAMPAGEPHLLFSFVGAQAVLGPFVVPGLTACQRCIDAALTDADPRHGLVLAQYARQAAAHGVPPPLDPLVVSVATALAATDVVRFLEGDRPLTWSATLTLPGDHGLEATPWPRHPRCGCAWTGAAVTAPEGGPARVG